MKQLKLIAGIFLFLLFGTVSSQYYYFDSGGNTYQQGCNEKVSIRINSEDKGINGGEMFLIIPNFIEKPWLSDITKLSQLFVASTETFLEYTSDSAPFVWVDTGTILRIGRSNKNNPNYRGVNKLFGEVNFQPVFSGGEYEISFGMFFETKNGEIVWGSTIDTTLSTNGVDLINSGKQNLYRTGTFQVQQEPCVADTNKPTISKFSISDGATKISYVSGISLKLLDNGGVSGTGNVPYIWKNGLWTGNTENRSNQYGINSGTFVLNVSCTNCDAGNAKRVKITNGNSNFQPSGKTWQDLDFNYNITIDSGELFNFGVEKKITVTGIVYDRAGNYGTISLSFNNPVPPTLIVDSRLPAKNQQYVNLNDPIKLGIKDDWAGVNPNTIKITLNGINGTEYGPYVFSGSDLNLLPVSGDALTDDFKITISNHEDFPVSGTIQVSWEATDNEGTLGSGHYSFSTRPSCSELQCCDPMEIWFERSGGNYDKVSWTGGDLAVTGSNLATGYVDGNTGYVNCNSLSNGLTLFIRGEQTGSIYTDELDILGTGIKGIISGYELILSLLIDDITLVADLPYSGQYLNGNDVNFVWHVEGVDDYSWISGYVVEVYSGGELYTTGLINSYSNTGWQKELSDGEYEWDVYAFDGEGNESKKSEKNRFVVDTVNPGWDGQGLEGGMGGDDNCTSQTGFIITGTFSEAVTGVRLSGENVIINNKEGISTDGITYIWEVELTGGTGTVRLITDGITDLAGNHFSGSSDVLVIGNYDANAPVLDEIIHATGFECQTITGSVSVSDGGCSSGNTILYKWNDIEGEFMHSEYSGRAGTGIFVVSVFDSALNRTDGNVNFVWQDSPITFEHESIDLGVLSGFEYIYSINDLINMFGARDGTCGTGTISLTGGNTSGVNVQVDSGSVKINVDVNAEGSGYFEVILSDDEGNEKTGHVDFGIKSRGLKCTIVADRTACGTGKVNLVLTGNGKYLSWNNWSNMVETGLLRQEVINQNQKMFTGYIKNEAGETGICFYNTLDSVLDNQGPILSNNLFTGYQCDTISVVLAPIDTGCAGNTGFRYSWSGGVWTSNNKGNFLENNVKTGTTIVQIVDSLGNLTQNEITLRWNDALPKANSFTLEAGAGEVNRSEKSNAREGSCSVDRLTATVSKDGEKGSCVISGKSLTFIPKDFVVSGPDSCTLQVKDPEGNTVDIIVDVRDINKLPSIRLNKPLDGSFFNYGSAVDLSWTVVDPGLAKISGFIYELDSVTGHVSGYTDRTYVSGVVLEPGNYNWKVSMILANTNHKIISTEYKLHVYAAGGPVKDFCPNGDYSNSFYDGTCERQHGSATECVENFEDYSEEQQKAYLYAYLKGITTQCPTTLDGYLYRDHFAKMISVYAMEVVGKVPQYGKSGCDLFTDIADDNKELQDYMKLSCELQLMGLNEDGVTPKTYFDPHSIVTRAEFGTVFSRLIFGDTYNVKNGPEVRHIEGYWYKKHLAALKKYGIMTMVDGDWPKYLERRGRVMIMMDRADSYGLFEGKIPSENGVKALFTQELD